jgi:predicted ATPase/class 3 adenylate cyclase
MARSSRTVPTGTVTFLFSDVEGSTRLAQQVDPATYRKLIERHQRLLRAAFEVHGGVERGTEGDSFFVVFRDAPSAVAAAVDAQRSMQAARWPPGHDLRVRIGLHTGKGTRGGDDYVGLDVNRAARIASAAHGGQVVISDATRALSDRSLPDGVALRDLGEHHLKSLEVPEHLYQLVIDGLASDFPPLLSKPARAAHLPPRLTSFVGRDAELAEVVRLLASNRLVTLVGPGGTGKTSLATECVREIAGEYPDGAWFIPLDTVLDPELVASEIVGALELQDSTGRPARERLKENLAARELLLLLDNFEQVIEASALVGELVVTAPGITVLVTSRAPLHLTGEQLYPVAPLAVPARVATADPSADRPDPVALMSVAAVRLFVDRAQQAQPAFRLTAENAAAVADICARLDGLPLGIELAAARIPLLGAAGIRDLLMERIALPASRSRDAPAHQGTLRETIAWSHDLLDPPARVLFARLSVFAYGCAAQEAAAICGPAAELGAEVIDTLAALVDQSLVTANPVGDNVRYGMLETIRTDAAERLEKRGEAVEIRRRHALTYLALAEAKSPLLGTRQRGAAARWFEGEGDNIQAAIRWSIETGQAETGHRLVAALWPYWRFEGRIAERRSATLAVLDIPGSDVPSGWRMRALEAAGSLFYYSGGNDRADAFYRAQLEMAREIGDRQGTADALFNLAFTEDWRGRPAEETARTEELTDAYRELGDEWSLARTEVFRGGRLLADEPDEARRILVAAYEWLDELGDVVWGAFAASLIGGAYLQQGDGREAARWFVETLKIAGEAQNMPAVAGLLPFAAVAALELGRPEPAAVLLGAFEALSRRYGIEPTRDWARVIAAMDPHGRAKAALDPETFEAAFRRGRELTSQEAQAYGLETIGTLV